MELFEKDSDITLRHYQGEAAEAAVNDLEAGENVLLVMATGTGKTIVCAEIIKQILERKKRSLFTAHREELIDQAINSLFRYTGILPEKEKANARASRSARSVVGSIQTLQNSRLESWPRDHFGLLTVDEAHHACAKTYGNIISHFDSSHLLGVTATPDRADEKQLGEIYTKVSYEYGLAKAIEDKVLVPIIGKRVQDFDIDLDGLKIVAGDYQDGELGNVISSYVAPIAENVKRETIDRKTLLFLPSVASSKAVSVALQELGINAGHIDGSFSSAERKKTLYDFSQGKITHLCSCALLLEGYDEPSIEAIVMLRPTGSRALFAQCVGRGTRLYPGKKDLLLVEFTFNSKRLRLVTAYELFSQKGFEEKVRTAAAKANDGIDYHNFLAELEEATKDYYEIDHITRRLTIKNYDFVEFDPFAVGDLMGVDLSGEFDITYQGRKLSGAITQKQITLLERYGISDIAESYDKATASALISTFFEQDLIPFKGPITGQQRAFLEPRGFETKGMRKAQANVLIKKIQEADQKASAPKVEVPF